MMKKNENSRENRKQPVGRRTKRAMAVYAALVRSEEHTSESSHA